jgi:hypothetical protein
MSAVLTLIALWLLTAWLSRDHAHLAPWLAMASVIERVRVPANPLRSYQLQAHEALFVKKYRNLILRWARQTGKGITALSLLARAAMQRVGVYAYVSPTYGMSYRNVWTAVMGNGQKYIEYVIPAKVIAQRMENEQTLMLANGSIIRFLSADQPDRGRGLALLGVVADEFGVWEGDEALRVMRPSLIAHGGFLIVTPTPRGLNHYKTMWDMATTSSDWWCSTITAHDARKDAEGEDGSLVVPPEEIERELREGTPPSFIDQEFFVAFTAALQGAIYAEDLARVQHEGRIIDAIPHDPGVLTQVGVDLGLTGAAVIGQSSPQGKYIEILHAWQWEDRALPEVIATIRALPYGVGHWIGPHDLEQRHDTTGTDRLTLARKLGVNFTVVPRVARIEDRIDLVRRKFPMLKFDAKGAAPALEALQHYRRRWNERLKCFDPEPVHDKHSHLADALGTLLSGWRDRALKPAGWRPKPSKTQFSPYSFTRPPGNAA